MLNKYRMKNLLIFLLLTVFLLSSCTKVDNKNLDVSDSNTGNSIQEDGIKTASNDGNEPLSETVILDIDQYNPGLKVSYGFYPSYSEIFEAADEVLFIRDILLLRVEKINTSTDTDAKDQDSTDYWDYFIYEAKIDLKVKNKMKGDSIVFRVLAGEVGYEAIKLLGENRKAIVFLSTFDDSKNKNIYPNLVNLTEAVVGINDQNELVYTPTAQKSIESGSVEDYIKNPDFKKLLDSALD